MIAKLRIRKWVRNFLWEHCVGLSSHSVDSVPANTSPFHLSAFCFLLETGIPGSGRDQHCLICRPCAPATVSAHLGPHALEMLLTGCPSQLGSSWVCCRECWHLRTSPRLSPETAPSCCLTTLHPPNILFLGLFPPPPRVCLGYHLPLHSQTGRC